MYSTMSSDQATLDPIATSLATLLSGFTYTKAPGENGGSNKSENNFKKLILIRMSD